MKKISGCFTNGAVGKRAGRGGGKELVENAKTRDGRLIQLFGFRVKSNCLLCFHSETTRVIIIPAP